MIMDNESYSPEYNYQYDTTKYTVNLEPPEKGEYQLPQSDIKYFLDTESDDESCFDSDDKKPPSKSLKTVLCIVAKLIFTTLLFLGGIVSLMTFLFAVTNFQVDIQLLCEEPKHNSCVAVNVYQSPYGYANFSDPKYIDLLGSASCLNDANLPHEGPLPTTCQSIFMRWGWCLVLILITPSVFTLIRSLRHCILRKIDKLSSTKYLLCMLLIETLQTLGLSLLVFRVLPRLTSAAHAAVLLMGAALIPACLNLFCPKTRERRTHLWTLLDVLAVAFQLSAVSVWPLMKALRDDVVWDVEEELVFTIPLSLILTSLQWWENFVPAELEEERHTNSVSLSIIHFIREVRTCRTQIFLYTSTWKIFTTVAAFVILMKLQFNFSDIFYMDDNITSQSIECVDHHQISGFDNYWIHIWLLNTLGYVVVNLTASWLSRTLNQLVSFVASLLVTPVTSFLLIAACWWHNEDRCRFQDVIPEYVFFKCYDTDQLGGLATEQWLFLALLWWLSQVIIGRRAMAPPPKLVTVENFRSRPWYNSALLNQGLFYNYYNGNTMKWTFEEHTGIGKIATPDRHMSQAGIDGVPLIYMCATMWHENKQEMTTFFGSIFKTDIDHSKRKQAVENGNMELSELYDFESHIFVDDVMSGTTGQLNEYATAVSDIVHEVARQTYKQYSHSLQPPQKYATPYGYRLQWKMMGGNSLVVHYKDKSKIKNKKRWSQVMYMSYILKHRQAILPRDLRNTFILALDGDVEFEAESFTVLVDLMRKDLQTAAACGRIHPVGTGVYYWYQVFEYAIGHWIQKASESIFGCVLCSPGCFSLFRCSALVKPLKSYVKKAEEPIQHLQYDQGEDRWLCTLLIQDGWRIVYSSISNAYTCAPESFEAFYKQRRRWGPSTTANIYDLIASSRSTTKKNDHISKPYILYQSFLLCASVIGTGMIFLMIVEAITVAFINYVSLWEAMVSNSIIILLFALVCYKGSSKAQLTFAWIITVMYIMLMLMVLIGLVLQMEEDGWRSPSALFFFLVAGCFILGGLLHLKEIYCLPKGLVYIFFVPSMYMLLMIYSVFNLNDVTWGTREAPEIRETQQSGGETNKSAWEKFVTRVGKFFSCCPVFIVNQQENENFGYERLSQNDDCETGSVGQQSTANMDIKDLQEEYKRAHAPSVGPSSVIPSEEKSWFQSYPAQSMELDQQEEMFFNQLIQRYLLPVDTTDEKVLKQIRRDTKRLKKYRDEMAGWFMLVNAMFVTTVFVLQRYSELIYLEWPIEPKNGAPKIKLDFVGIAILLVFGFIMLLQMCAMVAHRFEAMLHVMANRNTNFDDKNDTSRSNEMKSDEVDDKQSELSDSDSETSDYIDTPL